MLRKVKKTNIFFRRTLGRVYGIILQEGIKGVAKRIQKRYKTIVFEYTMDLSMETNRDNFYHNTGYVFRQMDKAALMYIEKNYHDEIDDEKVNLLKERVEKKRLHVPYIVMDSCEENVLGYFHIAYDDFTDTYLNYKVVHTADQVHFFDDYTFMLHRKKGVHKYSVAERINLVRAQGFQKATVHIEKGNTPSEKAYMGFGFKPDKRINYFHLFSCKRLTVEKL